MRGDDDGVLEAAIRREMTIRMGEIIRAVAMTEMEYRDRTGEPRPEGGCRVHGTTDECIGSAVMRAIDGAGYALVLAADAAVGAELMARSPEDGTLVVGAPNPVMFSFLRSYERPGPTSN